MTESADRFASALNAEIAEGERYAADLAHFAAHLRALGHDDAAQRLLKLNRKYRVAVLGLRGKLAASTMHVK